MTSDEYQRAAAIAQRACYRWSLSKQDWEEVRQDAALAAWRNPEHPTTAAWWGARDSAEKILGTRRVAPIKTLPLNEWRAPAATCDLEAEVLGAIQADEMLAGLTPTERVIIEATVIEDRTPQELSRALGMWDSTVRRRQARGLQRMKEAM